MSTFPLEKIIALFPSAQFIGNRNHPVTGVIGLTDAVGKDCSDQASWVSDKNSSTLDAGTLKLGLLILSKTSYEKLKSASCNFLIVDNPRATFFKLVSTLFQTAREAKIEKTAIVHDSARIGNNCYIGHHVVIESGCTIGDNTTILHNTIILEGTIIGNDVIIGCNNTIGNYGFGYEKDESGDYEALQHIGHVVIHDRVEIHNNTCIDRGVLGNTEIFENVKIDNLVHVAHGVVIERNSLIIANAMIGGSARIGENSWIAPTVSIINKGIVAPNTMTGMGAVILKNTEENYTYVGNPAVRMDEYKKWSEVRKKLLGG